MKLTHALCLCLALALALPYSHQDHGGDHDNLEHHHHHDDAHIEHHDHHELDRCQGLEMDAVAVNEDGIPLFFKGDHLFKGFDGKSELSNESFAEMDDHHHLAHVDAAFHMHCQEHPDHDHMFFFLDHKVFVYHHHKLEVGYPKEISEVFPGIPNHLDAAVECPKPECDEHSVLFFKDHDIYDYNVKTKAVEKKVFQGMPNCTSALRYMGHHYCFHGHNFCKFDPKTGQMPGKYPKEARDYFMRCSNFSENSDHVERERCSHVHLDAITSDHGGNMYAFRDHHFLRRDEGNHTLTADRTEHAFKEIHSDVDAVFSFNDHLHMIKDDKLYVFQDDEPHNQMDGYPKSVKEELGIEGPIDAAFVCEDHHIAHIIKGNHIYDVELNASPRVAVNNHTIGLFKKIDAAKCDSSGVKVFVGSHFYHFNSTMEFVAARALPEQHRVSMDLFSCEH
ncbi:hemopexin [Hippoglossus hippoglossus]|uniref:hemopexin n=1 Tax=Hippoglossus hippoglossus TaxID=8267 RepID=UPI00148CA2CB|nr:hemopexin [Hippoglossus hippoglossus]